MVAGRGVSASAMLAATSAVSAFHGVAIVAGSVVQTQVGMVLAVVKLLQQLVSRSDDVSATVIVIIIIISNKGGHWSKIST